MRYVFVAPHYCCIQWRIPFGYRIDLGAGSQLEKGSVPFYADSPLVDLYPEKRVLTILTVILETDGITFPPCILDAP